MSARSGEIARRSRRLTVEAAIRAGTCHIGSALSIVDVLAVIYGDVLGPDDHFLLSKGHAASALYATLAAVDVLPADEVLHTYCADGSRLAGHPERGLPGVEMTGGSLGHGPAIGVGIALAERDGGARTLCLVGDGELDEGSVWEALALAGHLGLARLTIIVDANGLQGLGRTSEVRNLDLTPRLAAVGFAVSEVPGHDHDALHAALTRAPDVRPRAVIARTIKGYGISTMEDEVMSHYRSLRGSEADAALAGLERV